MNQIMDSLDKLKDLPVVRFFAQFLTQKNLEPFFANIKARVAEGQAGHLAKELLVWAVLLALGTFIIDQIFYWTKPGKVEEARERWQDFRVGAAKAGAGARDLFERARDSITRRAAGGRR